MILFLEITISILFFTNKLLIFHNRKSGWLFGILGAILAIIYFYTLGLYIYTALEIGLIIIIICGLINPKNPKAQNSVRILTILVITAVTYLAFSGLMTLLELVSSYSLIIATHFLVRDKTIGWALMLVYHVIAIIITVNLDQYIFALFQVLSIPISILAIHRTADR